MANNNRSVEESVMDKLLLLHVLDNHKIDGITKLQKTIFLAENDLVKEKTKALNYSFIRYNYGPFSRELGQDISELEFNGFVTRNGGSYNVTSEGKKLLEVVKELLSENSSIIKEIDQVANFTSKTSLKDVKKVTYKLEKNGVPIENIPMNTPLVSRINETDALIKFKMDRGWVGTLEVVLNPEIKDSLNKALSDNEYIDFKA